LTTTLHVRFRHRNTELGFEGEVGYGFIIGGGRLAHPARETLEKAHGLTGLPVHCGFTSSFDFGAPLPSFPNFLDFGYR
jgi:hypothetical protein